MKDAATAMRRVAVCGGPAAELNPGPVSGVLVNAGIYRYHQRQAGVPPHFDRACDGYPGNGCVARTNCPIRACAMRRQLSNCASCGDLFCDLLEADMAVIEGAIRDLAGTIPAEDFELFLRPFLIRARLIAMRTAQ